MLNTNTSLITEDIVLKCKQLWMEKQVLRAAKRLPETHPVFRVKEFTKGHHGINRLPKPPCLTFSTQPDTWLHRNLLIRL